MNKKINKYIYEYASENDGTELSELLEETSFEGDYQLVYTRRPSVYESINKDSDKFAIIVGRNKNNNQICGMGICSVNKMLINGKIENVGYLSGFRKKQNIGGDIIRIYRMFNDYCKENNVKYTYTTILEDNLHAQKMLTKKRKSMPDYIKIADYTVNIFKSNLKYKSDNSCEKAKESDFETLKIFIEKESKNQTFFPYIDLNKEFFGLNYKDFYLLKNSEGQILACGILWNQTNYKQLIVKHYSIKYKIILHLSNWILKLINFPVLPKENEIINYSTLSFVLYKDGMDKYLNDFIKQVSRFVKEKLFVYASIKELSEKITPMKYKSFVYIVDWNKNFDEKELRDKNLYIECGLL